VDGNPRSWPPGQPLTQDQVLRALGWVGPELRVLLILRDAGNVPAESAEPIVHVTADKQAGWLDEAREVYVNAMELVVNGRPAGEIAADGAPPGTRAVTGIRRRDLDCRTMVKVMGRWLDGELSEGDSDGYEQHLLFCPACLVHNDKTRLALAALRRTPTTAASSGIRQRLVALLPAAGGLR
jgi:hypothetical protein